MENEITVGDMPDFYEYSSVPIKTYIRYQRTNIDECGNVMVNNFLKLSIHNGDTILLDKKQLEHMIKYLGGD